MSLRVSPIVPGAPVEPEKAGCRKAAGRPVTERDLCVWLGTLASWRSGLVKRLVRSFGSVDGILAQSPLVLAKAVGGQEPAERTSRSEDEARFRAVLERGPSGVEREATACGGVVIAWCDQLYPPRLRHLADPPLCLFVRAACGPDELRARLAAAREATAVAVVGTRGPSLYGAEMARLLGRDLSLRGLLVVSGLAMGVDAAAHRGALEAGGHTEVATLAVLGCGADVVYPRVNRELYDEVMRHGLVVSEFAWRVPARAWRFPARNRVMAALAGAVVIVEGAERSGARLTVDYALDLGREVLAVPGEAGRRLTAAPHTFLRAGAGLCESALDVVAALGIPSRESGGRRSGTSAAAGVLSRDVDIEYAAALPVLRALADGSLSADQAAARCALPVQEVAGWLSRLEVDGLVTLEPGGAYRLRRG